MLPTQLFTPPSSTVMKKTIGTTNTQQLAEFASSMVFLMWHARKITKTLVSERSYSPSLVGNDLAYLMWQSRKPMTKAHHYSPLGDNSSFSYTASPAFKKFCFQVKYPTKGEKNESLTTNFYFFLGSYSYTITRISSLSFIEIYRHFIAVQSIY